jgi:hypothetical protein
MATITQESESGYNEEFKEVMRQLNEAKEFRAKADRVLHMVINAGGEAFYVKDPHEPEYACRRLDLSTIPRTVTEVTFPALCSDVYVWKDLLQLPPTVEYLDLAHDGVIYGTIEEIDEVFAHLPNLKKVICCGYYSSEDVEVAAKKYQHRCEFVFEE